MAARVTLDEQALAKVQQGLASGEVADLAETVLAVAQGIVRSEAYITGKLHDSLVVAVFSDGRQVYGPSVSAAGLGPGITAFVGATEYYARWVHDGTVDTQAVPFLRRAASGVRGAAKRIVKASA